MPEDMALMTVAIPDPKPGIERAAEALGVPSDAVDRVFGVVSIDPAQDLYAVQVRASALPAAKRSGREPYRGPFANPRIEAFGPRKK